MSTPLSDVIDIINTLKSEEELFADEYIPVQHAKLGVIQTALALGSDLSITEEDAVAPDTGKVYYIEPSLTAKEIYLCGLYAFRNYMIKEHHKLAVKAVNFKTLTFAVTGLTERSKEIMRIVWHSDNLIKATLDNLGNPMGYATEVNS